MKEPNKIINDSVKSTLFGKFYEKIISGWLKETTEFTPLDGKPRIYWEDVEFCTLDNEASRRLDNALKKCKTERKFCTPDGFVQNDNRYYVWEAKNWPMWTEGKKQSDQVADLLYSMPQIMATKAVFQTREYLVDGFLFFWWSQFEGADRLLKEIRQIISPRSFDILYTAELLSDCIRRKYPWYIDIITTEKERMDELFKDLVGLL